VHVTEFDVHAIAISRHNTRSRQNVDALRVFVDPLPTSATALQPRETQLRRRIDA
jgi:hypothetical protein